MVQHKGCLVVLQGMARKQEKAPGESPQDPVFLQGSASALSHQAMGIPVLGHILEAIPTAMSSTTQLKFSCPNPSFLETQCYKCSPIVVPLMPHLDVVCTVPCVLLAHPGSLCSLPCVLLAPLQPALLSPL